jgi:hypothetical protein
MWYGKVGSVKAVVVRRGRVGSVKAVKVRRGRSRSVPVSQGGPVPVGSGLVRPGPVWRSIITAIIGG